MTKQPTDTLGRDKAGSYRYEIVSGGKVVATFTAKAKAVRALAEWPNATVRQRTA